MADVRVRLLGCFSFFDFELKMELRFSLFFVRDEEEACLPSPVTLTTLAPSVGVEALLCRDWAWERAAGARGP